MFLPVECYREITHPALFVSHIVLKILKDVKMFSKTILFVWKVPNSCARPAPKILTLL